MNYPRKLLDEGLCIPRNSRDAVIGHLVPIKKNSMNLAYFSFCKDSTFVFSTVQIIVMMTKMG